MVRLDPPTVDPVLEIDTWLPDPTKLVADSIKAGKPMMFVSINYRLNIFSFGDGKERNLALKDQRLGIEWVRKNIASFGGNPVSTLPMFLYQCISVLKF